MIAGQDVMAIGLCERSGRFEQPCQAVMGLRVRRLFGKDFAVGRDGTGRVAFLVRANLGQSMEQGPPRCSSRSWHEHTTGLGPMHHCRAG